MKVGGHVSAKPTSMARQHRRQEPGSAWGALLTMSASERATSERSVTYSGCREVRRLGKAPLYAGQPGYRENMDGDDDGIACENY